jgi:hypothetical protein
MPGLFIGGKMVSGGMPATRARKRPAWRAGRSSPTCYQHNLVRCASALRGPASEDTYGIAASPRTIFHTRYRRQPRAGTQALASPPLLIRHGLQRAHAFHFWLADV